MASLVSEHVAQPALVARWSDYDEAMFQRLTVQRKAAGYKGRGGGVSSQSIRVGSITPNTGTVVAVIAGLVAERGTVVRAELVTMMGAASFPHPKARPCDPGWCQGYIAGALRNGFLALADQPAAVDSVAV